MTSPNTSTADQVHRHTRGHCGWGGDGNWSATNIVALVLGFVIFWPIGLFFLYWIFKGRDIKDIPRSFSSKWSDSPSKWFKKNHTTDNVVFNEYQETQYDRIREIKDEIKDRDERFSRFRDDVKRRADEAEFKEFMSESPVKD